MARLTWGMSGRKGVSFLRRAQELLLVAVGVLLLLLLQHVFRGLNPGGLDDSGEILYDVAFSTDGSLLVRVGSRGVVVFDATSGTQVVTVPDLAIRAAFSPDGAMLATSDREGAVRLWKLPSGDNTDTLRAGPCNPNPSKPSTSIMSWSVDALAFAPDGRTLAAVKGKTVWLWDLVAGEVKAELAHDNWVSAVAFSPDGSLVATACKASGYPVDDNPPSLISIWDVRTGIPQVSMETATFAYVDHMVFSPDGQILATTERTSHIPFWDVANGKKVAQLDGRDPFLFSPDGTLLAAEDADGVKLIDTATKGTKAVLGSRWSGREVEALAFSPDSRRLRIAYNDGVVETWNVGTERLAGKITGLRLRESVVRGLLLPRVSLPWKLLAGFLGWVILWVGVAELVRKRLPLTGEPRDARQRSVHQVTFTVCFVVVMLMLSILYASTGDDGAPVAAILKMLLALSALGLVLVILSVVVLKHRSLLFSAFDIIVLLAVMQRAVGGLIDMAIAAAS